MPSKADAKPPVDDGQMVADYFAWLLAKLQKETDRRALQKRQSS